MGFKNGVYNFDEIKQTFGENLRKARKEKCKFKTQEAFAEAFGCNIESVRNWEQGRTVPETGTLFRLAEFLDCDLDYLIGRIDKPTHDLQFITDEFRLSSEAVKKLMQLSDIQLQSISEIIEHPKYGKMTAQISDLKDKVRLNDTTAQLIINHVFKGINDQPTPPVHENMVEQAIIYNLSTIFTQIVCDITDTEL